MFQVNSRLAPPLGARLRRAFGASCLALLFSSHPAQAYEKAYAFVFPVGIEWEQPTTSSGNANGYQISQGFCVYRSGSGYHTGTDLANGATGGEVRAVANGKIVQKSSGTGWGNMIRIEHTLTDGSVWYSQYGHMLDGSLTSRGIGSPVQMGEPIGKVGNTGSSTGAHLHIEIKTSNTDGPGYLGTSACTGSGFTDPLAFIQSRLYAQAATNNWQFGTSGEKEGWDTLPFDQTYSVGSGWMIQSLVQNARIYSPYMNRAPNSKIYVKFNMANQGTCPTAQFYLQTVNSTFNGTMVKNFSIPTDGHWSTIVFALKDVPEYSAHGNWRRFRIQLLGSTCATGNWFFDYIHYVTDNVAPEVQGLAVSPAGWSSTNSFTATWGGWDGPDDGSGYGAGITAYEISVNGGSWQDVGAATSWTVSGSPGVNSLRVRARDKVDNVGAEVSVPFYYDATPPGPITARVIPTTCKSANSFDLDLGPMSDNSCVSHYEYRLGGGPWQSTTTSYFQISAYQLGSNTVEVGAVDCAGNRGPTAIRQYLFDDAPPGVPSVAVSPNSYTNVNSFDFAWQVPSDAGCGVTSYEYMVGAQSPIAISAQSVAGAFAYRQGVNTFRVRAKDAAGNFGDWGVVSFFYDTSASAAPVVTASPATCSSGETFAFSWYEPSDPQGIAGYEYRLGWDGLAVATTNTELFPVSARREGLDTLLVRARDNSGNWSGWGFAAFCWDTTAPEAAMVLPTSAVDADSVLLGWQGVDALSGIASYDVEYREATEATWNAWRSSTPDSVDVFGPTIPIVPVRGHSYAFRVRATDGAGNIGAFTSSAGVLQFLPSISLNWTDVTPPLFGEGLEWRGVAWGDYDADGLPDICATLAGGSARLFHNEGNGAFSDKSPPEFTLLTDARGVAWGDANRDGRIDLVISTSTGCCLLRNEKFAGWLRVADPVFDIPAATAVAWADYDDDGWLDLFIASESAGNHLLKNMGYGQFVEAPASAVSEPSQARGASWGDFDHDGLPDLFISNQGQPSKLFRNLGSGAFEPVAETSMPGVGAGKGATWVDADSDGDLDLFHVGAGSASRFFRNDGAAGFADVTPAPLAGLSDLNGAAWADVDGDGLRDLFASGDSTNRLWMNKSNGGFEPFPSPLPAASDGGLGAAWADFDGDLDPDLIVAQPGHSLRLLRNDGSTSHHWLKVRLLGVLSNLSAIGARVEIWRGTVVQVHEVSGGSGYYSQDELAVIFGTGDEIQVDSLVIEWPRGIRQRLGPVSTDQTLDITESLPDPASAETPASTRLEFASPMPNPANGPSVLKFVLPTRASVTLRVYDASGRLVKRLLDATDLFAGPHSATWDLRDDSGVRMRAGVYHCRLVAGGASMTRRVVVLDQMH